MAPPGKPPKLVIAYLKFICNRVSMFLFLLVLASLNRWVVLPLSLFRDPASVTFWTCHLQPVVSKVLIPICMKKGEWRVGWGGSYGSEL